MFSQRNGNLIAGEVSEKIKIKGAASGKAKKTGETINKKKIIFEACETQLGGENLPQLNAPK